jgi:hypothetical protein
MRRGAGAEVGVWVSSCGTRRRVALNVRCGARCYCVSRALRRVYAASIRTRTGRWLQGPCCCADCDSLTAQQAPADIDLLRNRHSKYDAAARYLPADLGGLTLRSARVRSRLVLRVAAGSSTRRCWEGCTRTCTYSAAGTYSRSMGKHVYELKWAAGAAAWCTRQRDTLYRERGAMRGIATRVGKASRYWCTSTALAAPCPPTSPAAGY